MGFDALERSFCKFKLMYCLGFSTAFKIPLEIKFNTLPHSYSRAGCRTGLSSTIAM